jgi:Ca-activated chloride channel homolog
MLQPRCIYARTKILEYGVFWGVLEHYRTDWRCDRGTLQFPADPATGNAHWLPRFVEHESPQGKELDHGVRLALTVLLLFFLSGPPSFAGESSPVLRKRVSEVRLALVATDHKNRPIPNLSATDIAVVDDGHPVSHFELRSATDLPLRLGVVVDLSDSTLKSWPLVKKALADSLQQLLRPNDETLVLTFGSEVALQRILTEPAELNALVQNSVPGGLTALYDSLYRACDHAFFAVDNQPHRSVLILFSDGEDDLSRRSLNEAIAKAQFMGIAIYALSNHNRKHKQAGDAVLHDLAASTGGRDFVVNDERQLQRALSAINGELLSSYLLYYPSPQDPGTRAFRRVFVLPTHRNGLHVRSRGGYFTLP